MVYHTNRFWALIDRIKFFPRGEDKPKLQYNYQDYVSMIDENIKSCELELSNLKNIKKLARTAYVDAIKLIKN